MPVFEKNQTPTGTISIEMRDTSGAFVSGTPTVTVSIGGAAYAAYGGTLSPISGTSGEWEYLPTSTETNAGKFKVKAVLSGAVTVTREVLPEVAYTATRAGYVDALNGIVASVWGYATRVLTADPTGVGTLLSRLTAGRATGLDNLDATVSSRLATSGYTAPPNDAAIRADVQTALTSQGYTTARAGYLDTLNGLVAAVWGSATRTLSAFGFNVTVNPTATAFDGIQPNAAFFSHSSSGSGGGVTLSVPAVLPGYTVPEGDLPAIRRGDSWSASLTGLGTLTGRTKLWATVKRDPRRGDAQADLGLTEAGGLVTIAGSTPASGQSGLLVVTDTTTGAVTLSLSAAATAALGAGSLAFDVQILVGSTVRTLASGNVAVVADVTRAVA